MRGYVVYLPAYEVPAWFPMYRQVVSVREYSAGNRQLSLRQRLWIATLCRQLRVEGGLL